MELDKRIIKGKKPLTAFDVMESKFIGTDCYFSDKASDYGDLSNCQKGCLSSRDGMTGVFNATKNNSYANFNYCLPCEWVKPEEPEKKYRPFTLDEFVNKFSLGDEIILKIKENNKIEHKLFIEYIEDAKNINARMNICLGGFYYSLKDLFDKSELYIDGGWKPFGVEE